MNTTLVISLALLGQCGSGNDAAQPDAIAIVEVLGEFRDDNRFGWSASSWGIRAGTHEVVVKAVAEGDLEVGQRLELEAVRPFDWSGSALVDRVPLRPFDVDLYVGERLRGSVEEMCSLPDGMTGQRVLVELEGKRLVGWCEVEPLDVPAEEPKAYFPPRSGPTEPLREVVTVVSFHGPTDNLFLSFTGDAIFGWSFYAQGLVRRVIGGESETGGIEIGDVIGVELDGRVNAMTNPFCWQRQSFPCPEQGSQSPLPAVLLGYLLRPTCLVHVDDRGRVRTLIPVPADYDPAEAFTAARVAARLENPSTTFQQLSDGFEVHPTDSLRTSVSSRLCVEGSRDNTTDH